MRGSRVCSGNIKLHSLKTTLSIATGGYRDTNSDYTNMCGKDVEDQKMENVLTSSIVWIEKAMRVFYIIFSFVFSLLLPMPSQL